MYSIEHIVLYYVEQRHLATVGYEHTLKEEKMKKSFRWAESFHRLLCSLVETLCEALEGHWSVWGGLEGGAEGGLEGRD